MQTTDALEGLIARAWVDDMRIDVVGRDVKETMLYRAKDMKSDAGFKPLRSVLERPENLDFED